MKLSLTWIADHIRDVTYTGLNISEIVKKFNEITAEIEHVETVSYDLKNLFVGRIINNNDSTTITLQIPELGTTYTLPYREDYVHAQASLQDTVFLVKHEPQGSFRWALHSDFGQDRSALIPALRLDHSLHAGSWRSHVPTEDTFLTVDNKSITHRPDMWGHRGFAREIAAFSNLTLKAADELLADLNHYAGASDFSVEIAHPVGCKRFIGLHVRSFTHQPSDFFMAIRLICIGSRVVNALVDITNYIMLDWSQPTHAYDAATIDHKKIIVRAAHANEVMTTLSGEELTLTEQDLVIASPNKILGLAGIKGGLLSSITPTTQSLFFEAATFDAAMIRKTAFRLSMRTDAAARFEKTLSADQPYEALARFVKLAQDAQLNLEIKSAPICAGAGQQPKRITVHHSFLCTRSGINFSQQQIITLLQKLEFSVTPEIIADDIIYTITVPHWRASKDIAIAEDILEEVIRAYGFSNIPLTLPSRELTYHAPVSLIMRERTLLRALAFGRVAMLEQKNYVYYDSDFMRQIAIGIDHCAHMLNPVSQQFKYLVDSLLPNLFKNVVDNSNEHDIINFFEVGRTWKAQPTTLTEEQRVSGIFFAQRGGLDFYKYKEHLTNMFDQVGITGLNWNKQSLPTNPWNDASKTATLWYHNRCIGSYGYVDKRFLRTLGMLPESEALIFDLDWTWLTTFKPPLILSKPLPRYQINHFDLSLLVPVSCTFETIQHGLEQVDQTILKVNLKDSFTKPEWNGARSLTMRVEFAHPDHTMTKQEIDSVYAKAVAFVQSHNITIRS